MYEQRNTWLPSSRQMGLGGIGFADLQRAARRSRGMGQTAPAGGLAPGSTCYDPTHDAGIVHCGSFVNVILSAFGLQPNQTTTCSAAEQACLFPQSVLIPPGGPGLPVGYDPNTGLIDPSNTTGATQPGTPAIFACPAGSVPNTAGVCYTPVASTLDWCSTNFGISCSTLLLAGLAAALALGIFAGVKR